MDNCTSFRASLYCDDTTLNTLYTTSSYFYYYTFIQLKSTIFKGHNLFVTEISTYKATTAVETVSNVVQAVKFTTFG